MIQISRLGKFLIILSLYLAYPLALAQDQEPIIVIEDSDNDLNLDTQTLKGELMLSCQDQQELEDGTGFSIKIYKNTEAPGLFISELKGSDTQPQLFMQTWFPLFTYVSGFFNEATGEYQAGSYVEVKVPFIETQEMTQFIVQIHEEDGEFKLLVMPTSMGLLTFYPTDCVSKMVWTDTYGAPRTAPKD